jgi:alcohol dehydrogenase
VFSTITNIFITAALRLLLMLKPPPEPRVFKGEGSTEKLARHVADEEFKSVLIVTSEGMVRRGRVEPIIKLFGERGIRVEVFTDVPPDPPLDVIEEATTRCLENDCEAVFAYGGGSVIDAAKGIAAQAGNGVPIKKLIGAFKLKSDALPLYAVPSTAGSGSEVSNVAVLSSPKSRRKLFLLDNKVVPLAVALDPIATVDLPKAMTAATGMDALTHAVESYISTISDKKSEELSLASIAAIFNQLPRAFEQGEDLEARTAMAAAAYDAGVAFTRSGLGYVHAVSHQLTAYYGIPHGVANGVILPYVLRFSKPGVAAKLANLARAVGMGGATDDDNALADGFIERVRELSNALELPAGFPEIEDKDMDDIAAGAIKQATSSFPVPKMMSLQDCKAILSLLKEGRF